MATRREGNEDVAGTWSMCASSMLPFFSNTTSKSVSGSCRGEQREQREEESSTCRPRLSSPAGDTTTGPRSQDCPSPCHLQNT